MNRKCPHTDGKKYYQYTYNGRTRTITNCPTCRRAREGTVRSYVNPKKVVKGSFTRPDYKFPEWLGQGVIEVENEAPTPLSVGPSPIPNGWLTPIAGVHAVPNTELEQFDYGDEVVTDFEPVVARTLAKVVAEVVDEYLEEEEVPVKRKRKSPVKQGRPCTYSDTQAVYDLYGDNQPPQDRVISLSIPPSDLLWTAYWLKRQKDPATRDWVHYFHGTVPERPVQAECLTSLGSKDGIDAFLWLAGETRSSHVDRRTSCAGARGN